MTVTNMDHLDFKKEQFGFGFNRLMKFEMMKTLYFMLTWWIIVTHLKPTDLYTLSYYSEMIIA